MPKLSEPRKLEIHARSVEEAEGLYRDQFPPLRIIGSSEGFQLDVCGVQIDGLMCLESSMSCGGGFTREAEYDGYVLSHYVQGGVSYRGPGGNEWRVAAGELQMIDGRAVESAWRLPGTRLQSIWVDAAVLHEHAQAMTGRPSPARLRFQQRLDAHQPGASAAIALANLLQASPQASARVLAAPLAVANLREALLRLLFEGLPHQCGPLDEPGLRGAEAPRAIRRAIEFMHAHAHEPIDSVAIAGAAFCSVRALQAGFRRHCDCTPSAYLRGIRLRRLPRR